MHSDSKLIENQTCDESKVLMAVPVRTDCGPHGVDGTDCGPHGGSSSAHTALSPLLHDTEAVSAAGTLAQTETLYLRSDIVCTVSSSYRSIGSGTENKDLHVSLQWLLSM